MLMNQLFAILRNTLLQTVRQPIYGLIILVTLGSLAMSPAVTGWTLDDDNKLLRDLVLSALLLQGVFLAAFGASSVISVEIDDKTVLTVASKPVSRWLFILGKFCGVFLALLLAHYIGVLGMMMTLRHGVLQTASEKSDMTVIIAGPGVMLLVMLAAAAMNYLFDWRFLSSTVVMAAIGLSIGTVVLTFIDRKGQFRTYEITQDVPGIPENIDPEKDFKDIIIYRDLTEPGSPQKHGLLVRNEWLGPISDADREYLMELSDERAWRMNVDFLVIETRKTVTPQIAKAAILLVAVLGVLTSFAVMVSTRLSTAWTLMLTVVLLAAGLVSDYFLRPLIGSGGAWSIPAAIGYYALPNMQFFWLIDAISEDRVIPWSYLGNCFAYAGVYSLGMLGLGAALFETREVG